MTRICTSLASPATLAAFLVLSLGLVFVGCGGGDDGADDGAADVVEVLDSDAATDGAEVGTDTEEVTEITDATDVGETEIVPAPSFIDEVDLTIGTMNWGAAFGATFPGPTWPFGMIQPGPETAMKNGKPGMLHTGGYFWGDDYMEGFGLCHVSGIGAPDYGHLLVMATDGMDASKTVEKGYRSRFSHEAETLEPGYYSVLLQDTGIFAEVTAGERTAIFRFHFPDDADPVVLMDLGHGSAGAGPNDPVRISDAEVDVDPETGRIEGWAILMGGLSGRTGGLKTYFAAEVDRPVTAHGVWNEGVLDEGGEHAEGDESLSRVRVGAWFHVTPDEEGQAHLKVGISFIDVAAARANLDAAFAPPSSAAPFDFDVVRGATQLGWEALLSRIEVEGGTDEQREIFYTAFYHSYLMPHLFTDADGRYRGFDQEIHDAAAEPSLTGENEGQGFRFYSNFSMWDTYRNLHSLVNLLNPEVGRDFAVSLVKMWEQGGRFPRWPIGLGEGSSMVGESAFIVLADTWVKGITDWDADSAWEGILYASTFPEDDPDSPGPRSGYQHYIRHGYVPSDVESGASSKTLEFAYDDFCIAQLAEAWGMPDEAAMFGARGLAAIEAIWNDEQKFFDGRLEDGSFYTPFNPKKWEDFWVEGNAWQYRFFVPWDAGALANLFGGVDELVAALVEFFEGSVPEVGLIVPGFYYWHGNEPDIHTAWLFSDVGRPDLTQRWVRWIMDTKYSGEPDGIDGNDDCGTMSAWYVFAALGFYPIPGRTDYLLGSPVFEKATLRLPGGDLVIAAEGASPENIYVQSATWHGEPLDEARLHHADLAAGGELQFVMGPEPSDWGKK